MTTAALFYPLTTDHLLDELSLRLSDAQRRVYQYWKTIDPKGYRIIPICTKAIAEALGLTRRTVQLALNKLASKKLIRWDKSHGLIAKFDDREGDHMIAEAKISQLEIGFQDDRQGERMIAKANVGSPKRSYDRQQPLEVNQGIGSERHKINKINKIKDLIDQEEIFEFENNNQNSEPSIEEIRALIRSEITDVDFGNVTNYDTTEDLSDELDELSDEYESLDESDDFVDEDLLLSNEDEQLQGVEENETPKTDLQLSTLDKPKTPVEVDSFRRRVEDFVLKTLNKSFPTEERRAAYFRKFDAKSWKKWETDYRESIKPVAAYKPYVPEKVEVAAPEVALGYIAKIKAMLGKKS